ncbi:hypothetical protein ElyMa_006902900 [Elysia marginata]|uniref:Uncharacterized protein n=1 Tax=Elysia marginata TaxID=1093978 RepID=A0AAV4JCN8_9GAST|nr:hypothetical protein ElyMa_006902900 [Elysia marginata]
MENAIAYFDDVQRCASYKNVKKEDGKTKSERQIDRLRSKKRKAWTDKIEMKKKTREDGQMEKECISQNSQKAQETGKPDKLSRKHSMVCYNDVIHSSLLRANSITNGTRASPGTGTDRLMGVQCCHAERQDGWRASLEEPLTLTLPGKILETQWITHG